MLLPPQAAKVSTPTNSASDIIDEKILFTLIPFCLMRGCKLSPTVSCKLRATPTRSFDVVLSQTCLKLWARAGIRCAIWRSQPDAKQGARPDAVRALPGTGNAAARRPRPAKLCNLFLRGPFVRCTVLLHSRSTGLIRILLFNDVIFESYDYGGRKVSHIETASTNREQAKRMRADLDSIAL